MCCTRQAANAGPKKVVKNRHLGTIPQLCRAISSQLRHVSTIGKKLVKQQYLLHMANFNLLAAEIVSLVWGTPTNFNGFVTAATSLNGSQPNYAQCLALTWAGRLYIHFRRLLLRSGILPGAKFTVRPLSLALSYWQRYCTAVEHWVRAKLCGVEHRAPPIFSRATITLGTGPHVGQCPT